MAHVRQQIRDAVATAIAGGSVLGTRVSASRVHPVAKGAAAAAAVFTLEEDSEAVTINLPRRIERLLSLAVEISAEGATFDDTLDAAAVEVEEAIGADPTLGGLAKDVFLSGSLMTVGGDQADPAGALQLVFQITYHTLETDAENAA